MKEVHSRCVRCRVGQSGREHERRGGFAARDTRYGGARAFPGRSSADLPVIGPVSVAIHETARSEGTHSSV
ncbi:hypothetical protein B296_00038327 [Ensete ventricosum]|uniref:Uncharacterized protein n=1 Tax=Ensete ventricosum TaxID=4639 RepID=A0A426ZQW0_ENSVE|nr:hypothetical protein B296_00038327 [Ensete ventricosum]